MSTFYIKNNQILDNKIKIIGDDVKHIKNVLRYKIGDLITLCDEMKVIYSAKILSFNEDCIETEIFEIIEKSFEPDVEVTLFQGLPKFDKMEYIVQKCTEMGVFSIVPVSMEHSIVKLDEKTAENKVQRWNKIALEASKQCGRQRVPNVTCVTNFQNIVEKISKYDIVLLLYEGEIEHSLKSVISTRDDLRNIAIVIGPEGGFAKEEVSKIMALDNVYSVSLGPRILRTETAGLVALAMIMYEKESLS